MYLFPGFGFLWGIFHVLGWILSVMVIVWVIRLIAGRPHRRFERMFGEGDATTILRNRYARGDITREQFESMRRDLADDARDDARKD